MAATYAYGSLSVSVFAGEVLLGAQPVKAAFTTSSYVPNVGTNRYFSHITNECTGTGYTAGGFTLSGLTTNYDASRRLFTFDALDLSTPNLTIANMRYIVVYVNSGSKPLLFYVDLGAPQALSAQPVNIIWSSDGLLQVRAV